MLGFLWRHAAFALGVLLIALGLVRRAKKAAFGKNVITPVYFHKPNRRLLVRCLDWLTKNGFVFVSAEDVIGMLHRGEPVPAGAVWLSFDDGWREWLNDALPVLRERGIPATLFIPSCIVEGDGKFPWWHDPEHPSYTPGGARPPQQDSREAITAEELAEMAAYPEVTIGSHTLSHPLLPFCRDEQIQREIRECKEALERMTGKEVKCFAYPEGRYDGRERRALIESGHELAVTTRSSFITPETDCYLAPRFGVGDDVSFPQAMCSMVGVWRPVIDPMKGYCVKGVEALRSLGAAAATER